MLSRSRNGWAAKTCASASDSAAASRAWTGRVVSPSALIASCTKACWDGSRGWPWWSWEAETRSSSSTPSANISSTSTPARTLMPASCSQVPIGSLHDCTSKVHAPSVSGHTVADIRDTVPGEVVHPLRWPAYAVGVGQHHLGAELVVALAEHQGRHVEELAHGRLRRVARQVDDGGHVHDRDTADHGARLSESGRSRKQWPNGALGRANKRANGRRLVTDIPAEAWWPPPGPPNSR